jgi:hypothetical protein
METSLAHGRAGAGVQVPVTSARPKESALFYARANGRSRLPQFALAWHQRETWPFTLPLTVGCCVRLVNVLQLGKGERGQPGQKANSLASELGNGDVPREDRHKFRLMAEYKTERWCEIRIRELLGPGEYKAGPGRGKQGSPASEPFRGNGDVPREDRHKFRLMAEHKELIVPSLKQLEQVSRAKLLATLRSQAKGLSRSCSSARQFSFRFPSRESLPTVGHGWIAGGGSHRELYH